MIKMPITTTDIYKQMDEEYGNSMEKCFGPGLLTYPEDIYSSRMYMFSSNLKQILTLLEPDVPHIMTGYENTVGEHNHAYKLLKGNWIVKDIIPKYGPNSIYMMVLYNPDEDLYDIYNEQLVITGANIIFLRKKFLKEIEKIAFEKHRIISSSEVFSLNYTSPEEDVEAISEYLRQELKERRREEFARRQSCVGPHRDDIEFKINGIDASKFASQGQQRTLVLALKLSELEIIKEKTGFSPVLLLDDVLAELDEVRQNYLLKSIGEDTQTIITSVDTLLFEEEFLKDVIIYNIENGGFAVERQSLEREGAYI